MDSGWRLERYTDGRAGTFNVRFDLIYSDSYVFYALDIQNCMLVDLKLVMCSVPIHKLDITEIARSSHLPTRSNSPPHPHSLHL